MHDEFRLRVEVKTPRDLLGALKAVEQTGDDQRDLPRLAVTHEQDHIFLYADSKEAAERARDVVQKVMADQDLEGEVSLWRWHPIEERWEDAAAALPATEQAQAIERERRDAMQSAESQANGHPEWEVRITVPSHRDAQAFAERLQGEGIPVQQRWRHLLVGANNEDQARALAQRLRAEAPAGSEIVAEGSGLEIWKSMHPLAIFGGMAN
jgi:hypothetical protein